MQSGRVWGVAGLMAVVLLAPAVWAQGAPSQSLRPLARPDALVQPLRRIPDPARRAEALAALLAPAVQDGALPGDVAPDLPPEPSATATPSPAVGPLSLSAAVTPSPSVGPLSPSATAMPSPSVGPLPLSATTTPSPAVVPLPLSPAATPSPAVEAPVPDAITDRVGPVAPVGPEASAGPVVAAAPVEPAPPAPAPVLAAPAAVAASAPEPVFSHPDTAAERLMPPRARRNEVAGVWVERDGPGQRPRSRPATVPTVPTAQVAAHTLGSMFLAALRPEPRPRGLARRAAPTPTPTPSPEVVAPAAVIRPAPGASAPVSRRGSVCGVPGLQGEVLAPIIGRVKGCGVAQPVRVTAVDGVRLSQGAIMDCETARALHTWVQKGLQPAFKGQVTGVQVAGHYVCRTRNHKSGARLSEHSKGKAIDISAIHLAGGQSLSVLRDWRGRQGPAMKAAHRAACGIFGTTLGPGSDGMHEDHMHFDTASHRNGAYCR